MFAPYLETAQTAERKQPSFLEPPGCKGLSHRLKGLTK